MGGMDDLDRDVAKYLYTSCHQIYPALKGVDHSISRKCILERFGKTGGTRLGAGMIVSCRPVRLIHLKCIYFFKHFSQRFAPESHHTWIKLLNLTLFLANVFFLFVFARNKIEEKYHRRFSPNKGTWSYGQDERGHRAQKSTCGVPP
jgi:hypothetical protein